VTAGQFSLILSGAALALSIAGFIWSIWKEFIFVKPRAQASFAVMEVLGNASEVKRLCVLNVTNMGPGPVHLYCCLARERLNWRMRAKHGMLNPIEGDATRLPHRSAGPFSDGLPLVELQPGKSRTFYFPYVEDCFLKEPIVRIGVQDTYGRNHWCRHSQVRKAKDRYQNDF
jgi:hypothetical protein